MIHCLKDAYSYKKFFSNFYHQKKKSINITTIYFSYFQRIRYCFRQSNLKVCFLYPNCFFLRLPKLFSNFRRYQSQDDKCYSPFVLIVNFAQKAKIISLYRYKKLMNIIGRKWYCITSDYNTCQHRKSMIGIKLAICSTNLMICFLRQTHKWKGSMDWLWNYIGFYLSLSIS